MKKLIIIFSTLLSLFTVNVNAAGSTATPVSGEVIEQDRGGIPGLEFPPTVETATIINNENQGFVVKGRLGSGGIDYFTFTMDESFKIILDQFKFEKDDPSNSSLSDADITYNFILVDNGDVKIKIPETDKALFSDLAPGTYTVGITSPEKSAATYDITVSSSGFLASLPLMYIGIGLLGIIILAGGLLYWKKSKK